jgi:hypothetical protein
MPTQWNPKLERGRRISAEFVPHAPPKLASRTRCNPRRRPYRLNVQPPHSQLTPRAPLGGFALALLCLAGCPQLLDDDFTALPALASNPDADVPSTNLGGGAGSAGSGAAGAAAGSGGSGATEAGGASGNPGDPPDGGTPLGGSGNVDAALPAPDAAQPEPLTPLGSLIDHRYSFAESGSLVADSVGGANGDAVGAVVAANSGKITLSGVDQYVNLPNGLISDFDSVTFEAWVNWTANPALTASNWQTIFSFGDSAAGEDQQGQTATTYVYFTPKSGDSGEVRGGFTLTGFDNEVFADGDQVFPASSNTEIGTHMAVVVDSAAGRVSMYVQGELVPANPPGLGSIDLSAIADVNNWLGRSQFASDPEFQGDILEFRIYGSALSASDVELSFSLGPDAAL